MFGCYLVICGHISTFSIGDFLIAVFQRTFSIKKTLYFVIFPFKRLLPNTSHIIPGLGVDLDGDGVQVLLQLGAR